MTMTCKPSGAITILPTRSWRNWADVEPHRQGAARRGDDRGHSRDRPPASGDGGAGRLAAAGFDPGDDVPVACATRRAEHGCPRRGDPLVCATQSADVLGYSGIAAEWRQFLDRAGGRLCADRGALSGDDADRPAFRLEALMARC